MVGGRHEIVAKVGFATCYTYDSFAAATDTDLQAGLAE